MSRNGGKWSDARYRGFVVSALRAASGRWPPKYESLFEARTEKKINPKSGRLAQHFECNECKNEFTSKDIEVDHIQPVVEKEFVDWNTYIERLFCEKENFQVLCKPCHKKKTLKEKGKSESKQKRRNS